MNVKRFTARTSRDALALVRQAFGDDAVVMSTRPCAEGVEVLAMAPESVQQLERIGAAADMARPRTNVVQPRETAAPSVPALSAPPVARPAAPPAVRSGERLEPTFDDSVAQDVEQLQMSTLSFQDYVRDRMLKRREAQLAAEASIEAAAPAPVAPPVVSPIAAARTRLAAARSVPVLRDELAAPDPVLAQPASMAIAPAMPALPAVPAVAPASHAEQIEMMGELRSMRGLIEQRFGALAFMEKLQRHPRQAQLAQKLLGCGFSPALIRKLVEGLPADVEELTWASGVLERNLATAERETPLEDAGGIFALIGATGVGKTTSTAKLAAAFAARHGAAELGLITLDAYRVAAHEQLRTYGRILGVPVHTAHDRASLEDLLDLLSAKRMVLIDTAGMAQRDSRTRELLEMISHRSVNRLLVVNASAQGETIEDQLAAYAAPSCRGIVLSKLDEAVKLAPALDSMIRHKLKVIAVANGQRVPEDWHRLSANALVQRALKSAGGPAWRLDDSDVNLVFAGMPAPRQPAAALARH
ncbi:MAG: flagellar biosynthesis protein FlhF [Rubrivivax sp.]|nr:flagellar biosynthesis protein FlhF [Rubrivivax sp.]MDP3224143.1 flagellar biosynthesis protein FlhF [Rubrivivax sp.]